MGLVICLTLFWARNRYPVSAEDLPMNELESVIPILSVRSLARSMDYYVHQLGVQTEPYDALR